MNRRDLIIVAVLMNAGLLVTLFLTSLKEETKTEIICQKGSETVETPLSISVKQQKQDNVYQVSSTKKGEPPTISLIPPPSPIKKEETNMIAPKVSESSFQTILVEKGDVLEKIARHYGISVQEIMELNHLKDSRLQIGQELKVPKKPLTKESKKIEKKYYVVQTGDTPWTIAKEHDMEVGALLKLNDIDEEKAKRLRPGDQLVVLK